MKKISLKSIFSGASGDSFFLIFVRVITLVLGILITRVLSGHFSLQEYGTYSQVMLLITTISSMITFGLMDGINYYFCREVEKERRDSYVSTIFGLQYIIGAIVSALVLLGTVPISKYFGNESIKPLIIFAAVLPVIQNTIQLLQVLFVAIGKAKQIAVRNFIVSILKLVAVTLSCYVFNNIAVVFLCQLLTDGLQVAYFIIVLNKNNCKINLLRFNKSLIKEILTYCIPMAMFAVIKSLNRDANKFVISYFTDTETLAVYTNASKLLPFDIIMTSFVTVLIPYITRYLSQKKYEQCHRLYKSFLELSYIATTILAMGAICVAPELMRFLYTEKYTTQGFAIIVFIIYIFVDIVGVLNITLLLTAAGKTKTIMFASVGAFAVNMILNIILFFAMGEVGPALSTLIVTIGQGILLLSLGAKELKTNIIKMFDVKYLLSFVLQLVVCSALAIWLRSILVTNNAHYIIVLMVVYALFVGLLLLLNIRRLFKNFKFINSCKIEK